MIFTPRSGSSVLSSTLHIQARTLKKLVQQPIFPSRDVTVVVVDDATQHIAATHWPGSFVVRLWDGNVAIP